MDRDILVQELERDEGMRLKVYQDSLGIPTIGVGRNLRDRGITRGEAYNLLHNDIQDVVDDLNDYLPWWSNLDEVRQRVLANMCFNLGIQGLLKFVRMLEHLQVREWNLAAVEMRASAWYNQVGPRAARLEAAMRTGEMT